MTGDSGPRPTCFTDEFVIFLHIQKTAGITIHRAMIDNYGPSAVRRAWWKLTRSKKIGSIREAMQARTSRDRYFVGHVCYGAHRFLPQPSTYVTFLREPVSRIVSLYNYSRSNPHAYYYHHAVGKTIEQFVFDSGLLEMDNGMTRFLAGSSGDELFINRAPLGSVDDDMLSAARANIESSFSFVGVSDLFKQSFVLLAEKLRWKKIRYRMLNKAGEPPSAVSDATRERILEWNKYDLMLYQEHRAAVQSAFLEMPDGQRRVELLSQNHG